jgi:hypothetical protein
MQGPSKKKKLPVALDDVVCAGAGAEAAGYVIGDEEDLESVDCAWSDIGVRNEIGIESGNFLQYWRRDGGV